MRNLQEVKVKTGTTEEYLGSVKEKCSCLPKFAILDPQGTEILIIDGPYFTNPMCCNDIEFPVGDFSFRFSCLQVF